MSPIRVPRAMVAALCTLIAAVPAGFAAGTFSSSSYRLTTTGTAIIHQHRAAYDTFIAPLAGYAPLRDKVVDARIDWNGSLGEPDDAGSPEPPSRCPARPTRPAPTRSRSA